LKVIIIAAVAQNGVIGKDEKIPWHSSEEFKHFKKTTLGFPVVMGRKTFESLGKPLQGRENIVITRNKNYSNTEKIKICSSLNNAIVYCKTLSKEKIFIIGGSQIYREAISIADELLISEMKFETAGNIFFPEIDKAVWINEKDVFENDEFKVKSYKKTE